MVSITCKKSEVMSSPYRHHTSRHFDCNWTKFPQRSVPLKLACLHMQQLDNYLDYKCQ